MSFLIQMIAVSLLILFSAPITVSAAGNMPARGSIPFSTFDKDESGFISKQEFTSTRNERRAAKASEGRLMRRTSTAPSFESMDRNGDGQLTAKELTAGQQQHMQQRRGGKAMPVDPYGRGGKAMPIDPLDRAR